MRFKNTRFGFQEITGDGYADYQVIHTDEPTSGVQYYGHTTIDGRYIILRAVKTSDVTEYKIAFGKTGYASAWSVRGSLDYYFFYELEDNL